MDEHVGQIEVATIGCRPQAAASYDMMNMIAHCTYHCQVPTDMPMELGHTAKNGFLDNGLSKVAPTVNDQFLGGRDLARNQQVEAGIRWEWISIKLSTARDCTR